MENKGIIESLLFFSAEPVEIDSIANYLNISYKETTALLEELSEEKFNEKSGILLKFADTKVYLTSNKIFYKDLKDFFGLEKKKDLTKAALEVLSIIAYKQPVTKAEIERIRGVKSDHMLRRLLDEDFIYISETLDAPGRPNLYMTTDEFLIRFNITSLDELPEIDQANLEESLNNEVEI